MLSTIAKRIAARLPDRWQQAMKRRHFRHQIATDAFFTNEPEWKLCSQWLLPGDWAIDVGANIGHYTKQFSDLVGSTGRVIAFEPVPATFELLSANTTLFASGNVTLLNLAASDTTQILGMNMPRFDTGLKNYYEASITTAPAELQVMTCAIDFFKFSGPIRVLKIDAEGHDAVVVRGAKDMISTNLPTIVMESGSAEVQGLLEAMGYRLDAVAGSSNVIYRHPSRQVR